MAAAAPKDVILGLLIAAALFLYLAYLTVSLLKSWYGEVGETIAAGERPAAFPGRDPSDAAARWGVGSSAEASK